MTSFKETEDLFVFTENVLSFWRKRVEDTKK